MKSLIFLILFPAIMFVSCHSPDRIYYINYGNVDVYEKPSAGSTVIETVNYLYRVETAGNKEGSYSRIIIRNPYNGNLKTGWVESRYLEKVSEVSRVFLKVEKNYSSALADCEKHYSSACTSDCGSAGCSGSTYELLEFGWTPSAAEWVENPELQMFVYDGRGPSY